MKPRDFVKDYSIRSLVCCFSGGKDSLVATHYVLSDLDGFKSHEIEKHVVFVDTTVMCPGTIQFVSNISQQFGWNLKILKPEVDFWTLVGEQGYPMPSMRRRWCCFKLKLEPIRDFVRNLNPQRAEVTGLRRDESVRRRNLPEVFYLKKSRVWKYAPLVDWNEKDVLRYMRKYDLSMPPHYRLGIKETCLCGAFASKKGMQIVRAQFPEFFQKFIDLEARFKSGGAAFFFDDKPTYAKDFLKQKTLDEKRVPDSPRYTSRDRDVTT